MPQLLCYNCGHPRDDNEFFWLVIDKDNRDNCRAYDLISSSDVGENEEAIEIEWCPNCGAEQS